MVNQIMLCQVIVIILVLHLSAVMGQTEDYDDPSFSEDLLMNTPCSVVEEVSKDLIKPEEQTVSISLLWSDLLEHAAAALLRATLLYIGYNPDYIQLYHRDSKDPIIEDSHAISVEVPVKSSLQLQVRLSPRAADDEDCRMMLFWILGAEDGEDGTWALHRCDFIMEKEHENVPATIYIEQKWNNTADAKHIRGSLAVTSRQVHIMYVEHSYLADLIRNSNSSFYFLDFYQPDNSKDVWPVWLAYDTPIKFEPIENLLKNSKQADNDVHRTFDVNVIVLLKYANGKYAGKEVSEEFVQFSPSIHDLGGALLEYHFQKQKSNDDEDMKRAACRYLIYHTMRLIGFGKCKNLISLPSHQNKVVVVICKNEEQNLRKYLLMMKILEDFTNYNDIEYSTIIETFRKFVVQTLFINCFDTESFVLKITRWVEKGVNTNNDKRIDDNFVKGVILTNELAIATAPFLSKFKVPLLIYDVYSGAVQYYVRSITGRVEHLVLALRRFLADCGWKRLAVISDLTLLAGAVSAALTSQATELTVRQQNLTFASDIPIILQELTDAEARVFFVNSEAATAAVVLATAKELNMTPDRGFVWIVSEYNVADDATSVFKPYSVSFWWRGERKHDKTNGFQHINYKASEKHENEIKQVLEEKWRERAWPLHAASLLDSLLTISEGSFRSNTLETFWTSVEKLPVRGINQNLTYDTKGVKSPLIFVQQWGAEPRPRVLATWRGGEWRAPAERCPAAHPPFDGSKRCYFPSGDPFQPSCNDFVWIFSMTLLLVIGISFIIMAIYWFRKKLLAHNLRIKTEYAKRMLARRERVLEALSEHLIDRKELEIYQELGSGRFGRVHHGLLRETGNKRRTVVVAVKTLREDASSAEESEFLREASTLATLDHEHIIRFVGVCVVDGPPLLLMEHAFFGDLLQYLQERRCLVVGLTTDEGDKKIDTDEKNMYLPQLLLHWHTKLLWLLHISLTEGSCTETCAPQTAS